MNHPSEKTLPRKLWMKIIPIVITICALSCQSQPVQPDSYKNDMILFGDGGGFAGLVTTYALYQNGQVMVKQHQDSSFNILGKINSNTAKQVLSNYTSQGISDIKLNNPGNVYYFLEYNKNKKQRIVYDPYARKNPKELEQYIHTLNGLVRKLKKEETK